MLHLFSWCTAVLGEGARARCSLLEHLIANQAVVQMFGGSDGKNVLVAVFDASGLLVGVHCSCRSQLVRVTIRVFVYDFPQSAHCRKRAATTSSTVLD